MSVLVLSVCSWKGGVGKTTTAQHLAFCLARRGKRALLVDLDPMHGLSTACGVRQPPRTVTDVFEGRCRLSEVVVQSRDGIRLAPADTALAGVERALQDEVARERFVKEFLAELPDDFVIIDTPPSLGVLTINAFTASNGLIVATDSKFLSLEGLVMVLDSIRKVQARLNPQLQVLGVVPTMFTRTVHARECVEETRAFLAKSFERAVVFWPVPYTVRFAEASTAGQTLFSYAADCDSAKPYESIAEEVIRWSSGSPCVGVSMNSTGDQTQPGAPAVA